MPPLKRRANTQLSPQTDPPSSSSRRRRTNASNSNDNDASSNDDNDSNGDNDSNPDEDTHSTTPSSTDIMTKKLVRLALASEYSRQPIRRADIGTKVLGEQGPKQFRIVFEGAQKALRGVFGMELVELPARERVTVRDRKAAQKIERPSTSTKSWILTTTLPPQYRKPQILTPTRAPSTTQESTYTALYTFIISVILLNGGTVAEAKLERYLKRTNADTYTPIDRTDRLLQRLCKEGYLVRNRELDGSEEVIEYMVGPRGKVEVGRDGVAGLVREVYGRPHPDSGGAGGEDGYTPAEREEMEEFERRLRRSLGIKERARGDGDDDDDDGGDGGGRRRSRRNDEDGDEEDEE